jgi:molybdate transport system ATP-binding protein
MQLIDLMTGCVYPISQAGRDCKLDPSALTYAALAMGRALDAGVELVIVNKFSAQEAAGKGLRNELAAAATAGIPVLTAVPEKHLSAWHAFTGGLGTTMACRRTPIDDWWQERSLRNSRKRQLATRAEATINQSVPDRSTPEEFDLSLPLTCR